MTYGVPYSFVPGTKAKADEVNANFIDILNKIEDTNLRIDGTNENLTDIDTKLTGKITEKVEELSSNKVNLDLSNLDDTGKSVLNAKANASDIDGKWTHKHITLLNNVSLTGTSSLNYSLSSYLPKDSNVYEVLITINLADSGWKRVYLGTDLVTTLIPICSSNKLAISGAVTMPVGKGRRISISRAANYTGNIEKLYVTAYRKVR